MEQIREIDGFTYARMINMGAVRLKENAKQINDLNVFPIPDGDTGDNMLLTILGGVSALGESVPNIGNAARMCADGMLLSARGNSGVILSQLFDGIADGLDGFESADTGVFAKALKCGVKRAYEAVIEPCEGTILTVARCASELVVAGDYTNCEELLDSFISEAKNTLDKTPDMLPVLKKAGVIDSGGAGLVCISEGMLSGLSGEVEQLKFENENTDSQSSELDLSLFNENSVLEFGYCTELLLRLQNSKCDAYNFDTSVIVNELSAYGDSLVVFKTGTIVKIHVHTVTPDRVLEFCRRYGEFLKVKIENMSLQHNNSTFKDTQVDKETVNERKEYGVVAVCSGEGVKKFFEERGADVIVDGGQSMNPSTEDFLNAYRQVNADTIFVFPNNSNIFLAAKQAGEMFNSSDVRVIESKNIGDGFAALSMLNTELETTDEIVSELYEAMSGVTTAEVSMSIRDTAESRKGDYIGFVGKDIISDSADRLECAEKTIISLNKKADIAIIIYGNDVPCAEAESLCDFARKNLGGCEIYLVEGMQEIFDYIIIME